MNYKLATLEDINQFIELRILEQINDWNAKYPVTEEFKNKTKEAFSKMLGKELYLFIAVEKKQIVATAGLLIQQYLPQMDDYSGRRGYLCNVFTLPDFRRQGIQKKLMKELIDYAKNSLNLSRIDLHSSLSPEVYQMYEKFGFQFVQNNARLLLN